MSNTYNNEIVITGMNTPPKLYRSWAANMTCYHCGDIFKCHHSHNSLKNIQNETIKEKLRLVITNYCLDCGDNIIKHAENMDVSFRELRRCMNR